MKHDPFTPELRRFVDSQAWTFAKTYAKTWPHEYLVEERVDRALFAALAQAIDTQGYVEHFFSKPVTYLDVDGYTYWHMGNIINRCVIADTYHQRKVDGRLPVVASTSLHVALSTAGIRPIPANQRTNKS